MKHGVYRWVAICLGLCIFTAAPVRAGIPPVLVEQTVRVLVNRGATRSPALVKAVTDYYVQVASRSGAALKPTVENFVILEHAKQFVTSNPGLFSPAQAQQLQDQLSKDLKQYTPQQRPGALPLERVLEQNARQATMGEKVTISVPDHMITMEQAVQYWAPGWRNQLFGIFDKQGLDAIEQALTNTDKLFFTVENGKVTFNSNDDEIWNYQEQFEIELRAILDKQGLAFTDRQGKLVLGGPGQINAPLAEPLRFISVQCYVAQYGRLPSRNATDRDELFFGRWINNFQRKYKETTDPFVRGMLDFIRKYTRSLQTPQERSQDLKEYVNGGGTLSANNSHPRFDLYQSYKQYQKYLKKGSYKKSPETKAAVEEYIRFFEEHFDKQEKRTPQEWLAEVKQFVAAGGQLIDSKSAPGYKYCEKLRCYKKGLEAGIYPENSPYTDYIQFVAANWVRQRSAPKTLEEVYDSFLKYLREFKTYPKTRGETEPLYDAVRKRVYVNPQPGDPQWEKLKRLDDLARAAQRGEKPWERFDQADPLKRPRTGEKEKGIPVTPEIKHILQEVEKNYEELYENFPVWVQANARYFVTTYNTVTAFNTLKRQARVDRMTDTMSEILDTLNGMDLGPTEEGFNRVIFRGANPNNPKPTDFHLVSESVGIPTALSRRAVASMPQHIQVRLNDKTGDLDTLFLQPGVTEDEIRTVIENIRIPEGWQIRMGNHEIGFTDNGGLTDKARNGWIHLHIEGVAAETEEEMYDLSCILQINTKALIEGKNEVQIRSLYKRLFGNYYQR